VTTQQDQKESRAGLDIKLHPLVLINISDHFTRAKVQQTDNTNKQPRVIGALYGTQEGRTVEIRTSFELIYSHDESGKIILDTEYVTRKKTQYEQVFPKYEVLGWYSTSDTILPGDDLIHAQIMEFNDSPLFLTLSTNFSSKMKELPLTLYESSVQLVDDTKHIQFTKIPYKIETEESERIGVDHVANLEAGAGTVTSTLVPHLASMQNAVKMLMDRVSVIIKYLELVKENKVPQDTKLLRQISSLAHRLPAVDSPKFSSDFTNELNETLMITYLATITKGTHLFNELIDKYNVTYEKRGRRGGMY
jgi:COP9 signalosome complex subunit 6